MTTATTKDVTLVDIEREALAKIAQQRDALGDPSDVLQTDRAQAVFFGAQSRLSNLQRAISTAIAELKQFAPKIPLEEKWEAHLLDIDDGVRADLKALPPKGSCTDAQWQSRLVLELCRRIVAYGTRCDHPAETRSIETLPPLRDRLIALGYAMSTPEPGTNAVGQLPWYGSLADVRERLKVLRKRRDEAERQLDAALQELG